ncbi:hypothetical protein L2U69_09525 [Zavarzinia compransoris]|uniref:hypothetical protein n=1 Tax=Zavarzinia marina TaxID=2911065 RepID=UPI001F469F1B|nr:hypothetical protein [Zavarzinia marina]MCF4165881.1 hypothetical protein [Zavarzinia marina]
MSVRSLSRVLLAKQLVIGGLLAGTLALPAGAEDTPVTVRALSRDAKFIGSSMGGMAVTLRDAATGAVLAEGVTAGGTGDTTRLIKTPRARGDALAGEGDAGFSAVIDLARPTLVEVALRGPVDHPASAVEVTSRMWLMPGLGIAEGDGWVIEVPGFVVDLDQTPATAAVGDSLTLGAKVTMMCGCPVTPGGLWNADTYAIAAHVTVDGEARPDLPLTGGEGSRYAVPLRFDRPGLWRIDVYAHDPANGNTGVVSREIRVTPQS